ncbi:MAG: HAD-IIIA family hydrolase [Rhizomicrobium sp.]
MGSDEVASRAVFVDRDGVLNHNWFNPSTDQWESPVHPSDLRLCAGAADGLAALAADGYRLFVVSNQPSAALGKCTIADLEAVHDEFLRQLAAAGVELDGSFYAYSHPKGVVPALAGDAHRRKPSPYLIETAIREHGLSKAECWMIGDRDTDIESGQHAGVRTIQVKSSEPDGKAGTATPDFRADDFRGAARIVMRIRAAGRNS